MVNEQVLQGNWNEIKGKLRHRWGQLTQDELQVFNGNVDQLVGMIQRKTGEARNTVEHFLEEAAGDGAGVTAKMAEGVREYAHQAADRIQEGTEHVAESLRHGYEHAEESLREGYEVARHGYGELEEFVSRRPMEAALCCLGAGLITGCLVGLMLRRP